MTIGQTLKTYHLHAGMTQKEMAGGIVTQSFNSKVENDKRSIDADLLIKLLTVHHFDVVSFFSRLSNQSKNQYNSYYEIESEITFAKNTKNLAKLKEIETKLNQKDNDLPSWLKFRLELAYAWVTHSNDHISTELKAKVKSLIVGEDWDRMSFYFLSQAVVLMDIETSYELVKSAFSAFKKHPVSDPFTLQFVSWIAVNFLNCCYHEKADESYTRLPIKFLRELPVTPEIGFSDLLATYYESLFKHDDETKNEIIHILKKGNYYPLIKDTVA
ncbi:MULTISPECIES: helix-turn-helix domain-containing protein [Lactobacillus]|uniref:helix-turn-helix domain-containing protein n=1 Tax=Lactobacillus TaxID=1578 RepID=UPI002492032A|nr:MULTISPECIES: helix-turn-helix transcriptional regulator [Lactobacillus]